MIYKKDKIPSVICHTEDQMIDFKLFLSRHGGTVGVDRTFNLGHFFATTLVYKHPRVIKNDTKDHPIFIGTLLLHRCLIQNLLLLIRIHCHRDQVR